MRNDSLTYVKDACFQTTPYVTVRRRSLTAVSSYIDTLMQARMYHFQQAPKIRSKKYVFDVWHLNRPFLGILLDDFLSQRMMLGQPLPKPLADPLESCKGLYVTMRGDERQHVAINRRVGV
jgi:hypothetical protein